MKITTRVLSDQRVASLTPSRSEVIVATLLAIAGYVIAQATSLAVMLIAYNVFGIESMTVRIILGTIGFAAGVIIALTIYFTYSKHDISYLDVHIPDSIDDLYALAGILLLYIVLTIGLALLGEIGIETAEHSMFSAVKNTDPVVILYLIPISLFITGPAEELLFRNVIQKRLTDRYTAKTGIAAASVIFATLHIPAYLSADATSIIATLALIFTLSVLLGWLFTTTENIIVPGIAHGVHNAIQFAILYGAVT